MCAGFYMHEHERVCLPDRSLLHWECVQHVSRGLRVRRHWLVVTTRLPRGIVLQLGRSHCRVWCVHKRQFLPSGRRCASALSDRRALHECGRGRALPARFVVLIALHVGVRARLVRVR
jgi:hypothetical protein